MREIHIYVERIPISNLLSQANFSFYEVARIDIIELTCWISNTGKCGRVTEIRGWDNESGRSVANVTWLCGSTNVYRVGHKGKVDLKVLWPATNGHIYTHHLPVLGKQEGEKFITFA